MRLLVFSPWFPYPPDNGSRLRAWTLIERLARKHALHLVAGRQDDAPRTLPAPLADLCAAVDVLPWNWHRPGATGLAGTLRAALSRTPRDVLERAHPDLARTLADAARDADAVLAFELAADATLPDHGPPVVLDQIELSGIDAARAATRVKSAAYWRRRLRRHAAVTVVSDDEAAVAHRLLEPGKPPVHVVPNAVPIPPDPRRTPVPGRMLFAGSPDYAPNADALAWFAADVLPRIAAAVPDAHLVVTGRGAVPDDPRIRPAGWLPDLDDAYAAATLAVVPLRRGGGTRLKTIEAWAAGVPVAATSVGVAGLDATDGEEALVADAPDALADACVRLLTDPARAAAVAAAGRARAVARHDADRAVETIDALLRAAVEGK